MTAAQAMTGLNEWTNELQQLAFQVERCPIHHVNVPSPLKKIPQLKPGLVHDGEVKRQGKVQVILLLWPSS